MSTLASGQRMRQVGSCANRSLTPDPDRELPETSGTRAGGARICGALTTSVTPKLRRPPGLPTLEDCPIVPPRASEVSAGAGQSASASAEVENAVSGNAPVEVGRERRRGWA